MQLQKEIIYFSLIFLIRPYCTIQSAKGDCKNSETQIASQTKRINIFVLSTFSLGYSPFQAHT